MCSSSRGSTCGDVPALEPLHRERVRRDTTW
jgi:hypothetical protein